MARRSTTPEPDEDFEERIIDIDVADELSDSYREYAYSVIYSRALPDARDGLKPVHRRILFQMNDMGLRPDRGYVKSARVVGDVMGKLHPHSDTAIYDSLVRMAQSWAMRIPLVDGHGNFGSLGGDDPPAAMRYTEARLSPAAMIMTDSIDEDTVEFTPNYDGQELEPQVLPSAFPNLLVNGAAGIAVGMATNMAPHNLGEVVAAARHLIKHPDATLDDLMRFVPGPDLPTGGQIIGEQGIRDAYETGRGVFKMRATARIEKVTARREGIVVTELPFNIGPEKVIAKVKELVQAKKLQGITDLKDLSDRFNGLKLVIEVKAGFNPEAVLEQLYKLTPMEESFGINNVALVDGQPLTLGLKELLEVYLDHRFEVVRRRTEFRRTKRSRPAAPGRGPADRADRHRPGDPPHPRVRRRRGGQGEPDGGVRAVGQAGHVHPGHAAAPPDPLRLPGAGVRAGQADRRDQGPDGDPGVGRPAAQGGLRRAGRHLQAVRHARAAASWSRARCRCSRPVRWRSATTRWWSCSRPPACWPAPPPAHHEDRLRRRARQERRRSPRW